ncbi:uncharacterized protein [Asterias amurensis]|uniref:uncharacterized protein n=1 Tax=Asterias amurensis TaxID=7602 RepID=UPI003AB8C4E0
MAHQRHQHVIMTSPLWHRDILQREVLPDPPEEKLKELEEKFKLDCILVEKLRYKWSPDIIPKYDAQIDPYARHYFRSPMVQSLLRTTLTNKETTTSPRPKGSAYATRRSSTDTTPRHKHQGTPPEGLHSPRSSSLNTLSGRRRAPPPPAATVLAGRREGYNIDSVVATNQVTKYKPLNRSYDATRDWHARGYFQKPGVRKVLALTTLGKNETHKS